MTFKPTDTQIAAILEHAEQSQPLECCGVIADGEYVRLVNQATEHDVFSMDMRGFRNVARTHKIEAVVHSHVYLPPIASDADKTMCETTALPWVIVGWPTGKWAVIEPHGYRAPLIGRQWAWGSHDCYALVRDGFESYTGIRIPDFDRDWLFWLRGQNLILDHYKAAGFVVMPQDSPAQHCDIMAMKLASPIVNHLGLYLRDPELGGVILHQLMGRLSVREIYGGTYLHATELHLRHERFLEEAPK